MERLPERQGQVRGRNGGRDLQEVVYARCDAMRVAGAPASSTIFRTAGSGGGPDGAARGSVLGDQGQDGLGHLGARGESQISVGALSERTINVRS